jgi:hypothetical protein
LIRERQSRDQKRYAALREIGCIACLIAGREEQGGPTEIHHLVDKGSRKASGGNQSTIPLCRWCHRGEPIIAKGARYMRERFGPSMFLESRAFAQLYGSQRYLLSRVNDMLSSGKRSES